MASPAVVDVAAEQAQPAPLNKRARARKPLKPKNAATNDDESVVPQPPPSPSPIKPLPGKENSNGPSLMVSSPANKGKRAAVKSKASLEVELLDLQRLMEQMKLEKESAEVMLKEKDAMLERKEMELQQRGEVQEKLRKELKKLQKLKEFKPTLTVPYTQSMAEEHEKKGKKDRTEMKRPCPPYSLWCKDQWNEVKKEKPELDFKEISNILGAKWKTLSAEERKPYEEKYQAEKERYLQIVGKEKREKEAMNLLEEEQKQKTAMELLEQYTQFVQEVEKEDKNARKKKDPLKPKRPMSAFFIFLSQRRVALLSQTKNILEIAMIAGEEWKNLSESERAPYVKIANEQKEDYLKQMEQYKQKKEEESLTQKREEEELMKVQKQEALQLLKKKEKADNIIKKTKDKKKKVREGKIVDPNKPKKPATSFLLYSNEARKQLMQQKSGISNATMSATISVQWKELAEEEKRAWNEKAAQAMAKYKTDMEAYKTLSSAGNGDAKA